MKTYEPLPGSVAARAAEHLQRTKQRMRIGALAEAIGADSQSLRVFLEACLKHGVIGREKVDGQWWYFAGSGTPLARPVDDDEGDDPPPAPAAPPAPAKSARSVFDLGSSLQGTAPAAPEPPAAPPPVAAKSRTASLADWKAPARNSQPGKAKPKKPAAMPRTPPPPPPSPCPHRARHSRRASPASSARTSTPASCWSRCPASSPCASRPCRPATC